MQRPRITVAVPAYNRPAELRTLLETVASQDCDSFDVLVVEDCSPRQAEIRAAVEAVQAAHPSLALRFVANEKNLGYDGNLRRILELSQGEFTLFMGDDDLLRKGALARVSAVIQKNPNLGVILRAYEMVAFDTGERMQLFRYFPEDRFFPAGPDTVRTFFRRSVSVAGYTVHTDSARACATSKYDGTLLYQLHLSACVLAKRDGYFISDVLTAMRKDERQRHFFGSAEAEKGSFAPGALTATHSVNFLRGMLHIARDAESTLGFGLHDAALADLGNYSYAFLRLHARDKRAFAGYVRDLARLGFWHNKYFWAYSAALAAVPAPLLDKGIAWLKAHLPATPRLGKVYGGERASSA